MDKTFRFDCTIRCFTSLGTEMLQGFKVRVSASDEKQARRYLPEIASEKINDEGGDILTAPMERIEIVSANLT